MTARRLQTRERPETPVFAADTADAGRKRGNLPAPSAEQRERARQALQAKRAEGAARYQQDFLDAPEWEQLARERGVRLPQWHQAPTAGALRRWLARVGVSATAYRDYSAETNLSQFAANNPDWPLRAWVGLILEALDAGLLAAHGRSKS